MPIAINRKAIREYRLKGDETGTVFHWQLPDAELQKYLANKIAKAAGTANASTDQKNDPKWIDAIRDYVRFCLRGWDDFNDWEGKPVEFSSKKISVAGVGDREAMNSALFEFLAHEWVSEMSAHFQEESTLTKDQEKNSVPPSA